MCVTLEHLVTFLMFNEWLHRCCFQRDWWRTFTADWRHWSRSCWRVKRSGFPRSFLNLLHRCGTMTLRVCRQTQRMSHCSPFDIQITDWWRIMTMMRRINHNTQIGHFWSFSRGIGIDKNAHDSPFSLCNFFTDLTNNPELHHTFISEQFVSHHTKAVPQKDSGNPNVSFSAHCWVSFNHTWGPKTDW